MQIFMIRLTGFSSKWFIQTSFYVTGAFKLHKMVSVQSVQI